MKMWLIILINKLLILVYLDLDGYHFLPFNTFGPIVIIIMEIALLITARRVQKEMLNRWLTFYTTYIVILLVIMVAFQRKSSGDFILNYAEESLQLVVFLTVTQKHMPFRLFFYTVPLYLVVLIILYLAYGGSLLTDTGQILMI
jgi:hypothetical protein